MKIVLVIFIFSQTVLSFSKDCGVFSETGILKIKNDNFYFIINENTKAEIEIKLSQSELLKKEMNGVAFQLEIKKLKKCQFSCEGELVKVEKILSPFDNIQFKSPGQFLVLKKMKCVK